MLFKPLDLDLEGQGNMFSDTMKDATSKLQTAGNSKIDTTWFLHHINCKDRERER